MRECAEMLDTLGVSWVQAAGEAEFSAARLNAEGKVDAIITDDSDAFCFGAVRVLRNFTISGKLTSYYLCLISSKFFMLLLFVRPTNLKLFFNRNKLCWRSCFS